MHKKDTYSYLYGGKSNRIFRFSVKPPNIQEKQSPNEHLSPFSDKNDEKMPREKTYWLELQFYNTDRKMKNIIRRI